MDVGLHWSLLVGRAGSAADGGGEPALVEAGPSVTAGLASDQTQAYGRRFRWSLAQSSEPLDIGVVFWTCSRNS